MNLYGLKLPPSDMSSSSADKAWGAFWDQHRTLSMSAGSQAQHRARRRALTEPPDPKSETAKQKRHDRNLRRDERQRWASVKAGR